MVAVATKLYHTVGFPAVLQPEVSPASNVPHIVPATLPPLTAKAWAAAQLSQSLRGLVKGRRIEIHFFRCIACAPSTILCTMYPLPGHTRLLTRGRPADARFPATRDDLLAWHARGERLSSRASGHRPVGGEFGWPTRRPHVWWVPRAVSKHCSTEASSAVASVGSGVAI